MTAVLLALWLALVWCLLWGFSIANALAGVALGALIVTVAPPGGRRASGFHPVAVVRFGAVFAWALLRSSLTVSRQVLTPGVRLREAIVAVPLRSRSPLIATFVANAISLTPGTLTIELWPVLASDAPPDAVEHDATEPIVLYVHSLDVEDPDAIRADGRRFEDLAIAAFGSAEDRARAATEPPGTGGPP